MRLAAAARPFALLLAGSILAIEPVSFEIEGDWAIRVTVPGKPPAILRVRPMELREVASEPHPAIPLFNPKAGGWARGAQLKAVRAQETTSPHLLDPSSFKLASHNTAEASPLLRGIDYEVDLDWGTFGRLEGGQIDAVQTVYATYRHALTRLDAVVLRADGVIELRTGAPRAAAASGPTLAPGERHLGNVYLPGLLPKLAPANLFPILESTYPKRTHKPHPTVRRLIAKLKSGKPLRILAWGDSVTDGSYLQDPRTQRWQEQFVSRLRARFPKARIELLTQAWGGRNTGSYLAEPPSSPHNYQEQVLALKPDLIVSEFVNDAGLKPEQVEARYTKLHDDFQAIGADWIILTPHYVRPDWMNLTGEKDIDDDPRPYVHGLRQFAAKHNVALADASLRYGRLWRQGIPYNTLMLNAINHPNAKGLSIFADALMELFP